MTQGEAIWLDDLPVAEVDHAVTSPVIYYVRSDHMRRPVAMTNASQSIASTPFGEAQTIARPSKADQAGLT